MATQTPNLNLDLREASDIFNPLSTNSNFETLDTVISDIQKKGGILTYTTTASANLLKLSGNPTPNDTVFKFVAAGDANTWSYQEAVNNIVTLDGKQKTVKAGELYVAWVNAANAMVVIAWPDVVNAQTFDGKGPAEWATKAQLDAVNQTAANATQTAQAAATVANQALAGNKSAISIKQVVTNVAYNVSYNAVIGKIGTFPLICTFGIDSNSSEFITTLISFATTRHIYWTNPENNNTYRRSVRISGSSADASAVITAVQKWNGDSWITSSDEGIMNIQSISVATLI